MLLFVLLCYRIEALSRWRQRTPTPTYENLLNVCLKGEFTDSAAALVEIVNESSEIEIVNESSETEVVNESSETEIVNESTETEIVNESSEIEVVNESSETVNVE